MVTTTHGERRPIPVGEVKEIEINGKNFKFGASIPKVVE